MADQERRRGTPARVDWAVWREAYVTGRAVDEDGDPTRRSWPTLDEIAAMAGVTPWTVKERASAEQWSRLRDEHRQEVEQTRRAAIVAEQASQIQAIDRRGLTVADAGLALVGQRLTYLVNAERRLDETSRGRGVSAAELAALGLAARRWLQVKQAVTGVALDVDDEAAVERELRLADATVAAQLAEHVARRAADT